MYDPPGYLWALAGHRAGLWFNAFGMTDLVTALILGAVTAYQLIHVTPSGAPISELPLALVPTVGVPLLLALHITSVSALARASRAPRTPTAEYRQAELPATTRHGEDLAR